MTLVLVDLQHHFASSALNQSKSLLRRQVDVLIGVAEVVTTVINPATPLLSAPPLRIMPAPSRSPSTRHFIFILIKL